MDGNRFKANYSTFVILFVLLLTTYIVLFLPDRHLGLSGSSPSLLTPSQHPSSMVLSDAAFLMSGPDQQQMDQQQLTQGSAQAICAALPGLVSRQIQVCQAHPNTIQSVSDGARKVTFFNLVILSLAIYYLTIPPALTFTKDIINS